MEERQWREGDIAQVFVARHMGRVGPVVGWEGDKLLVLIDGREVKVEPSKVLLVKAKQTA